MNATLKPRNKDILAGLPGQFLTLGLLFSMISISLTQGFLSLAVVFWAVRLVRDKEKFTAPNFFIPLAGYALLSLVAAAFSVSPGWSFWDCRDLILILIVPVAYVSFSSMKDLRRAFYAVFASAGANMIYSLYRILFRAKAGERLEGPMDHYMTEAGLLVLFCALALTMAFFETRKIRFLWAAGFVAAVPLLVLTMTRSAWIGVAVVIVILVAIRKPKTLILLPVLAALFYFVSPGPVKDRARSIVNIREYSNRVRLEYARAGMRIIKDYPLTGTGPHTVEVVFQNPKYGLSDDAKLLNKTHLHNNLIQIAAERGIPALLVWLLFFAWAAWDLVKLIRSRIRDVLPAASAALAALTALFVSGFFEYNFGDSEVATLFFFLIAAPFAALRIAAGKDAAGSEKKA